MKCRHCRTELRHNFIDLGTAPPSNSYLSAAALSGPETWYPLRVLVCHECWLVQTEDYARAEELFTPDYAYFSSYSSAWLDHAQRYVDAMAARFGLGAGSQVMEVASNDGYLLQYVRDRGIPCLGVEPTACTAAAARAKGIDVVEEFFGAALGRSLAAAGRAADLVAANNVLAHVPDINDFAAGFAEVLKPAGVATFEFPHLVRLVEDNQFDTIYHEHFSYLSLTAVEAVFERNGLKVFDVEELPTHGGSLRVFAQRRDGGAHPVSERAIAMRDFERRRGVSSLAFYAGLQAKAERAKNDVLAFLLDAQRQGKSVAGYGAAAKGNTLLNFAGVRADLLPWVVDRNPAKQGKYLPGSRIPIVAEDRLRAERPDYVLILPWNLRGEVMRQLEYIREWGGRFVTSIPTLEIL